MMLSKSSLCIKYLLFFFNLIFVITGIVLISVGATVLAHYRKYDVFVEPRYISAAELIVAVGAIVLIVAFFGCCGAVKEHYCMTMTFAGILVLICILELAAGIAGYMLRNEAAAVLEKSMEENLHDARTDADKMKEWEEMQIGLHCCGAYNSSDWIEDPAKNKTLPSSCCDGVPVNGTCTDVIAYKEGCVEMLGNTLRENALSIGGVGIGIAFVQFLGIVLSCFLARAIRSEYETV